MPEAKNPTENANHNPATVAEARQRWEAKRVTPSLKRGPERREHFTTTSGIEVKREYNPEDLNGFDFLDDLGFPGEYPFTRGVQPTMYRGRLWTMRQYAGFGDAEESNRRYRYLFASGQTGLSVAFDLPTQMGRDADHPLVRGEVGRVGVSIRLDRRHGDAAGGIAARQNLHLDDDQRHSGDPARALSGDGGTARRALEQAQRYDSERHPEGIHGARNLHLSAARLDADNYGHLRVLAPNEVPNWNTISISGYHIREAGSTAAQELAFTIADGIAYVEAALKAGLQGRRVRQPPVVLLQRAQQFLRGDREVSRGAPSVGANHEGSLRAQRTNAR